MKKKLAIILPVYNGERFIEKNSLTILEYCQKNISIDFKIFIAVNGSEDNTEDIVKQLVKKYKKIKYIKINKKGKGIAIKNAVRELNYDWYCFIDSDLPFNLDIFKKLEKEIAKNKTDLILGKKETYKTSFLRRFIISKGYILLANYILFQKYLIKDFQTGFKAWTKDLNASVFNQISDDKWFFDTELIYYSIKEDFKISYINVHVKNNLDTNINIISDSIYFFINLLKLKSLNVIRNLKLNIILVIFASIFSSISYIFLKYAAIKITNFNLSFEYLLNLFFSTTFLIYFGISMFCLGLGFFLLYSALRIGELSKVHPSMALNFVWTNVLIYFFLKEVFTLNKLIGILFIIMGVYSINKK